MAQSYVLLVVSQTALSSFDLLLFILVLVGYSGSKLYAKFLLDQHEQGHLRIASTK